MNLRARRFGSWLYKCGEFILTAMLAVMFFAFLFQIAARYLFDWPTGWTNELSAILWIWLVLWGASFVVTEQEEMRFDLIYAAVATIGSLAILLRISIPARVHARLVPVPVAVSVATDGLDPDVSREDLSLVA